MAKVTGLTARRMYEIEQASVVSGAIEGEDELILYTKGGTRIRAGVIKGGTAEWIKEYKPIIDDHTTIMDQTKDTVDEVYKKLTEIDPVIEAAKDLPALKEDVNSAVNNSIDAIEKANDTIKMVEIEYALGSDLVTAPASGWTEEYPVRGTNQYIWMRTKITRNNGKPATYSDAVPVTGDKGKDGVGLISTIIQYAKSTSGTEKPTSGWQTTVPTSTPGQFLWTRTVWTYSDNSSETGYSVAMWGAKGDAGDPGVSVESVTPYYYAVPSEDPAPDVPEGNIAEEEDTPWQTTEPAWQNDYVLYRTELIIFDNGQFSYTPVTQVSSYQAASQAIEFTNMTLAFTENLVVADTEEPEHAPGRIWMKLASLDNGTDETYLEGIYQSNGEFWSRYGALYDIMLVPNSNGSYNIMDKSGLDVNNVVAQVVRANIFAADKVRAGEIDIAAVKMENLDDSEGEVGTIVRASDRWNKRTMIEPGRITIADQPGTAANIRAPEINLIPNPDGATGTGGWDTDDTGTVTNYTGQVNSKLFVDLGGLSKDSYLKFTSNTTDPEAYLYVDSEIAVPSGDKYVTMSALVATNAASNKARLAIFQYSDSTNLGAKYGIFHMDIAADSGARLSETFELMDGATSIRPAIMVSNADGTAVGTSAVMYLNNVWAQTFDDYYLAREAQAWSISNPSMALTAMVLEPKRLTMTADGTTKIYLDSEKNRLYADNATIKKTIHIGAHLMQSLAGVGTEPDQTVFNWVGSADPEV